MSIVQRAKERGAPVSSSRVSFFSFQNPCVLFLVIGTQLLRDRVSRAVCG